MKFKTYVYFVIIYVIVGFFTLNFSYVEGDDATTIMYHLLDRKKDFQPPYSTYHSMFDSYLSIITSSHEKTLRVVSIFTSFIFGLLSLCFLAKLIFLKNGNNDRTSFYALLLMPFILPEVLFSSLLVNPSLIAIALLFLSHICLLKFLLHKKRFLIIASIILFGLGVSFRWSCGFYLFILFAEYMLFEGLDYKSSILHILKKRSIILFSLYLVSIIGFIQLSGYSIFDIYTTFIEGNDYIENKEISLLTYGATAVTFLTPSLILLFFAGIYFEFKKKLYNNCLLFLFGIIPYMFIGLFPSYKYMITLIVPLMLLVISGIKLLRNNYYKVVLLLLIFIPWFIGIHITSNSAWGPGFEIKNKTLHSKDANADFNPDKSLNFSAIDFVFKSGMAIPTLEGPRPLFGFVYCFLYDWNYLISDLNTDRALAVMYAKDNKLDIIQDVKHSFISSKLIEFGYKTFEPVNQRKGNNLQRAFVKNQDTISIIVLGNKKDLFKIEQIQALPLIKPQVIIYSSYTNIISKIKTKYKDHFEQKSAYWGILSVDLIE